MNGLALASKQTAEAPAPPERAQSQPQRPVIGNQASLRRLQAKLTIGDADDPLEHEADAVAEQVMRMPDPARGITIGPPRLSRKCAKCDEDGKSVRRDLITTSSGSAIGFAPPIVTQALHSPAQSLDKSTRNFFEPRFGCELGSVRVHTDAIAADAARSVQARAFTVGTEIVFAAGQYAPQTQTGRTLLAHEITHVLQQNHNSPFLSARLFRSLDSCAELIANPPLLSMVPGGGAAVHSLIAADFANTPGAIGDLVIPGASNAPRRTDAICGGPSRIIDPQVVGGKSGGGMPDLAMKTASGILLIAEIKPAVVPCLIDGEEQELGYIDQGNANDPAQVAWRGQLGVTVVAPMREQNYKPPTLSLAGGLELEAAWCSDGLMGYSIYKKGQKKKIEHPVPVGEKATDEQKEQIRQRLPQIPDWVLVLITAALAVAIIACFASGACEAAGIIAAIGEAAGWILINAMRLAGIAFAASAAAR